MKLPHCSDLICFSRQAGQLVSQVRLCPFDLCRPWPQQASDQGVWPGTSVPNHAVILRPSEDQLRERTERSPNRFSLSCFCTRHTVLFLCPCRWDLLKAMPCAANSVLALARDRAMGQNSTACRTTAPSPPLEYSGQHSRSCPQGQGAGGRPTVTSAPWGLPAAL